MEFQWVRSHPAIIAAGFGAVLGRRTARTASIRVRGGGVTIAVCPAARRGRSRGAPIR
ncbi:hypothetical protein BRPE64_ACDS24540 [Caballeronia insecticola]|uniref:Uncharacterized protein n=1 Tax=Caballeronia insecticola TaxID=758793 RepID=R4WIK9_9BURK|nr:hypothetical protein BRPE64_ACDS24540 [Caballeronia insecticola]